MKGTKKESAVSETISTVLAVALTVILASLVAAYMFGMMPNIPVSRTLAYSADQPDGNTIVITYHGGPDANTLLYSNVVVTPSNGGSVTYKNTTISFTDPTKPTDIEIERRIGSMMTVTTASGGFINKDHIVIIGHFDNGQEQVVLDMLI